ncbi:hypothetical protein RRG08_057364 [Elysia crispata]|uniref:Uncharacterized protein n=1 Tax=Elysia crispata TaxID=231223 RepID=A0AAE0YL10_9GAST|nr:hypothetical protein RRG08_057364 [Elysia crispata]
MGGCFARILPHLKPSGQRVAPRTSGSKPRFARNHPPFALCMPTFPPEGPFSPFPRSGLPPPSGGEGGHAQGKRRKEAFGGGKVGMAPLQVAPRVALKGKGNLTFAGGSPEQSEEGRPLPRCSPFRASPLRGEGGHPQGKRRIPRWLRHQPFNISPYSLTFGGRGDNHPKGRRREAPINPPRRPRGSKVGGEATWASSFCPVGAERPPLRGGDGGLGPPSGCFKELPRPGNLMFAGGSFFV